MKNKKEIIGLDLVDYVPDYTKSLEENTKIYGKSTLKLTANIRRNRKLRKNKNGRCKMFSLRNIEIPGQVTYSSEIYTFLFWEIERQMYPRRKITIRRRAA